MLRGGEQAGSLVVGRRQALLEQGWSESALDTKLVICRIIPMSSNQGDGAAPAALAPGVRPRGRPAAAPDRGSTGVGRRAFHVEPDEP